MNKRLATLYDDPVNKRFDLTSLVKTGARSISLGRGSDMQIRVGEDCDSEKAKTISRSHASISYEETIDTFTYIDESLNGSTIKRQGQPPIILNKANPSKVLESGDQIYFSKFIEKGYGPLMFRQDETSLEDDKDKTQRID